MRIRVIVDIPGVVIPPNLTLVRGSMYDLPEGLAQTLINRGWAEEVKNSVEVSDPTLDHGTIDLAAVGGMLAMRARAGQPSRVNLPQDASERVRELIPGTSEFCKDC